MTRRAFFEHQAWEAGMQTWNSGTLVSSSFLEEKIRNGEGINVPASPASFGSTWFAQAFGIDDALIRIVMERALARGGDACDIFFEHSVSHSIRLEDGQANMANSVIDLGVGIRVMKGLRFGYAFTEVLTKESMLEAAETASAIAHAQSCTEIPPFCVASHKSYYPLADVWEEVGIQERMSWLESVDAQIKLADSRISRSTIYFRDTAKRILIATSEGKIIEDSQPSVSIKAQAVAEMKGRREEGTHTISAREGASYLTEARLKGLADETVRRTVQLFEAIQPASGEMPMVMGPGPSGILLHEAIGHGIEADFNRKNVSIFSDKMNKKVAIPEVTIIDSGIHPHLRGSINVDDEGNLSEETVLVEEGVLRSYLHDRMTAGFYKVAPTGSGRRESFRFPPLPRMRNTYMAKGPHDPEEIVARVKKGIYAESFRNGQVRIGEGSFSFYVASGYMIENGRLTQPIKDVNIVGNGPDVLSRIEMVGHDLKLDGGGWTCGKGGQSVPVSQGMPTALVSSITIGGRAEG